MGANWAMRKDSIVGASYWSVSCILFLSDKKEAT
jgi:hypothetical protein